MKKLRGLWPKLHASTSHALSLSFASGRCRWVYGEVVREGSLFFKSILASGGTESGVIPQDDALLSSGSLEMAIRDALAGLPAGMVKPAYLVVSVPSKHAYLGEISVDKDERENMIRYQIQDLMEAAAGQSEREAAFDWQVKTELSDGNVGLAVAGIDQKQVDEISKACQVCGLQCLGITLDSVAALNGYLQMVPETLRGAEVRFLLHGELSRHRVRLAVFAQGVLFNANSTRLINLQLRALETDNKIRTVSNPRVITSNKEPALIEQGTEIPYQIATSSGATATEFKEANLKLAVTPQIAPDGTVLLDVDVAKDSIGISTANGPAIDTRRVKTKVLVADGGTVVLGGIFEEDDNVLNEKVPYLGDIPGLGVLFKGKTDSKRRAELLIFLTPVVLADQ